MVFAMLRAKKIFYLTLCFSVVVLCCQATPVKLSFIGKKPAKGDTIPSINTFYDLRWDVHTVKNDGSVILKKNSRPDVFSAEEVKAVVLYTSFIVDSSLLHKRFALAYGFNGSSKIVLNNEVLLATGVFAQDNTDVSSIKRKQEDFLSFEFKDTLARLTVEFVPYALKRRFDYDLDIGQLKWAEKKRQRKIENTNESIALGSFYFSFAIIFCLLFVFFRASKDNLYFSLFCLFVAAAMVLDRVTDITFFKNFANFSLAIAIEFLSIFFARVLINKERSIIPLFIIILLGIICSMPVIFYKYTLGLGMSLSILVFLVCVVYAGFSALYFLLQGIGQKKWEARTITFGSLIGLSFNVIVPIIFAAIISQAGNTNTYVLGIMSYLPDAGLCIYPITVAIVLGRRNAFNQTQLINHVKAIEKLSSENIEKEKEKKKILEEQNQYLETKVEERTHELAVKNELILIKNKEITDSLQYAKRIQTAILPDIKLIYKTVEQSFILYMPKDIVSGDFYSFAQKNGKVIIAAADCTGHGVAGAFMSMIGSALLNQIINEKNITDPALILDELNEGVIHSLKQRDSESNDGMDISICTFDLKNKYVQYAGANRPLWLVRNNELITYKPDKFPIGGLQIQRNKKFTAHEITLQKNDTLYLFSDGYADQFGGDKGKKLMSRKFKDSLMSIQGLAMPEQEKHLRELFKNWKGNNEQVDDVLVVGIKI